MFDRWIIVPHLCKAPGDWAWSGSRWVPIDGSVQVCNFSTKDEARDYCREYGFELARPWEEITAQEFVAMSESEKRELARSILSEAFGPPDNEHKRKLIEGILNANYPPEIPELYDIARDITHNSGLPWTDPRTGKTHQPPRPTESLDTTRNACEPPGDER